MNYDFNGRRLAKRSFPNGITNGKHLFFGRVCVPVDVTNYDYGIILMMWLNTFDGITGNLLHFISIVYTLNEKGLKIFRQILSCAASLIIYYLLFRPQSRKV
jgi:hypothetical protein